MELGPNNFCVVLLIAGVAASATFDLRHRRIPNAITLAMLSAGFGIGVWNKTLDMSLLGMLVGALPPMLMYARGAMGGGDVKLLAAIGAIVGYPIIVDVLFYSIVFGALLSAGYLLAAGELARYLSTTRNLLVSMLMPGAPKIVPAIRVGYPFGVAAALASIVAVLVPAMRITGQLPALFE